MTDRNKASFQQCICVMLPKGRTTYSQDRSLASVTDASNNIKNNAKNTI